VEAFGKVHKKLEEMHVKIENAELQRIAIETKKLDIDSARRVLRLVEEFEDIDDVQYVYHNLEMSDELVAAIEEE
jgi:transcriptional/translational regulatory protein YebC/TACO1